MHAQFCYVLWCLIFCLPSPFVYESSVVSGETVRIRRLIVQENNKRAIDSWYRRKVRKYLWKTIWIFHLTYLALGRHWTLKPYITRRWHLRLKKFSILVLEKCRTGGKPNVRHDGDWWKSREDVPLFIIFIYSSIHLFIYSFVSPLPVKYVLKRVSFGSKDCTKELKLECAYFLGQTS